MLPITPKLYEWSSNPGDVKKLGAHRAARLVFDLLLIDRFEHALLELKRADCVWGPVHTSVGQEATAAATTLALQGGDKVAGTHRSHHNFLTKVMRHFVPAAWNPAKDALPDTGREAIRRSLAEIMGLADGYCGGRGGSMHLRCPEAGFLGSNAIVAGGIPLATGAAFAEKRLGTGNIVVSFFSDGAVNQGAFHEACNFAATWDLPILFFIENNFYSVATHTDSVCAVSVLAQRALAYNMDGHVVDGGDPVAMYETVKKAAKGLRAGGRPCFIEARCYRRYHHAGDQPGSAFKYRDKEEERRWAKREATRRFPLQAIAAGLLTEADVARITASAEEGVRAAVEACTVPGPPRTIRPELWPDKDSLTVGLRSDGAEWKGITFSEGEDFSDFTDMKYGNAIAAVTGRWLEKKPESFVLGEEVANFGGGAYGATRGLPARYPDRVLNTPISEAGIVGLALGAAMNGMRPVAEIMFPDFALVAADQLFSQVAKARHMYGNTTQLPLVIRTRIAIGCGYGGQHSMDPVGLYALFPGLRVVAPSDAFDYIGLFNAAMQSLDPVVFLEHHSLYDETAPVPKDNLDYFIPFGKARYRSRGDRVSVVAYGAMAGRCARLVPAWEGAGVSVEVIDLRTVDMPGLDLETIGASVKKTGAVVIAEEAAGSMALGPRIAARIQEDYFDYLDGPVACLTSADVPNPVSRVLEAAALLDDDTITETVTAVAHRRWK